MKLIQFCMLISAVICANLVFYASDAQGSILTTPGTTVKFCCYNRDLTVDITRCDPNISYFNLAECNVRGNLKMVYSDTCRVNEMTCKSCTIGGKLPLF